MKDKRIAVLAKQVIEYSVNLQKGERILIDAWDECQDFVSELISASYAIGAYPYISQQSTKLNRLLILSATEESMEGWYRYEENRMKDMDAYVVIRKQHNSGEYADIPQTQMALYQAYHGKLHYGIRIPDTKWCVLRYPNDSMAQSAGMSTEAFEDYYFNTCCLNYKRMNEIVRPLTERLSKADQVRIVGPGTDITFSIKNQCDPVPKSGIWNIPCGEAGFPVIPDSANGVITYNIPSNFQGVIFTDVSLTLEHGLITHAVSNHTQLMNQILDSDANSRRIGEFAMGFNPFVTKPILDTLFDEKMVMSLHFTPGNSPINPSTIHWDLITSHCKDLGGGEIWLDGELIRKDGLFITDDLLPINPDHMITEVQPTF